MQGCFEVVENTESEYDIDCKIIPQYTEEGIPQEQRQLYSEIEKVCSTIKSLKFTDESKKEEYFKKVVTLAQVGLAGPNAQPLLALESLELLKNDLITSESGRIKNQYMIRLGVSALILMIPVGGLLYLFNMKDLSYLNKYMYVFSGAMVGTWISFGARKINLTFEELTYIENDKLSPVIRLIFIGISSMILLLFIDSGLVKFSVGDITNSSIMESIKLQIMLGIIGGLIEYKLAINIFNKANTII